MPLDKVETCVDGLESASGGRLLGIKGGGLGSILNDGGSWVLSVARCFSRMEVRCALEREALLSNASSNGDGDADAARDFRGVLAAVVVAVLAVVAASLSREEARVRVIVGRSVRVGYSYSKLVEKDRERLDDKDKEERE